MILVIGLLSLGVVKDGYSDKRVRKVSRSRVATRGPTTGGHWTPGRRKTQGQPVEKFLKPGKP